jgi:hypothetical protein
MTGRRDFVIVPRILIGPSLLQPFPRICFIRRYQVKALSVNSRRVAVWLYVARHQEVERFDLVDICLSFVELCKGLHDGGACDRCTTNCRLMFETWVLRWQSQCLANHAKPHLRNPFSIFPFGIGRIQEVTEAVLRP